MQRILNVLRPVSEPEEEKDNMEVDTEKEDGHLGGDKWDAEALKKMSPWLETCVIAAPVAAQSTGRRLLGSFGGFVARGGAPQARMAKCAMAAAPPMAMPAPACAPMAAPGGACFGAGAAEGVAIGFKTGGAQDAANFRENVAAGKLPLSSDVTYEGIIKDYFFDTSPAPVASASDGGWVDVGRDVPPPPRPTELFAPTYSLSLAPDPLLAASREGSPPPPDGSQPTLTQLRQAAAQDVFLAVGLDSGLTDFRRPRLNLCILLDVSGSMDCPFNSYYYDAASGSRRELEGADARRSKLDVAKEVMKGMLGRLAPDDSVAISLFSDNAATPKRMGRWGSADAAGIKAGIDGLRTVGGTNFQAGLDEAIQQLKGWGDCIDGEPLSTENRLIVLTDAETNCGDVSESGLLARIKAAAADRLYTTIVGVGLDFQTTLVEAITKVRGASYFSVHTPGEFKQRLDEEFDFMVAPLVFDLELRVDPASLAPAPAQQGAEGEAQGAGSLPERGAGAGEPPLSAPVGGWRVVHVYGSPDSEERRLSGGGSIMRVNTLFPSAKTEEGIKGGVVLLRMRPPPATDLGSAPPLRLLARYVDRAGQRYDTLRSVDVPPEAAAAAAAARDGPPPVPPPAYFHSSGVRKAVVMARLVDALQCWLVDEWEALKSRQPPGADSWNSHVAASVGASGPATPPAPACTQAGPRRLRPGCPLLPPQRERVSDAAPRLSPWERTSQPLKVNADAKAAFRQLLPYVRGEVAALGDEDMKREVELLEKLAAA